LRPDRIAFYSYAHVPWTSKGQRLFDESHLPSAEEKILLYLKGKELLMKNGYVDIGMDHFALPNDDLYKAWEEGRLHRNFMGYTTTSTKFLLGLGVSSISDTGNAFGQNTKTLHDYYELIGENKIAIKKGYFLSDEDEAFRRYILDIICKGEVSFSGKYLPLLEQYTFPLLEQLQKDDLIIWDKYGLTVTPQGHNFLRNICSAFDLYLHRGSKDTKNVFSKAI